MTSNRRMVINCLSLSMSNSMMPIYALVRFSGLVYLIFGKFGNFRKTYLAHDGLAWRGKCEGP